MGAGCDKEAKHAYPVLQTNSRKGERKSSSVTTIGKNRRVSCYAYEGDIYKQKIVKL